MCVAVLGLLCLFVWIMVFLVGSLTMVVVATDLLVVCLMFGLVCWKF